MGAGGDVDEVVLGFEVERVVPRPIGERTVDLAEVPRITEIDPLLAHFGLGRDQRDVVAHALHQLGELTLVQELEAIDEQVVVLEEADGGTPFVPAVRPHAAVEHRADHADRHGLAWPGCVHIVFIQTDSQLIQ